MHLIKDGDTIFMTKIDTVEEGEQVKILYKKLLNKDISIKKSRYPQRFLSTLPYSQTTAKNLHKDFKTWLYNGAKGYTDIVVNGVCNSVVSVGKTYKNIYTKTVNNILLIYYLPKLLERIYLSGMIKKNDDHIITLDDSLSEGTPVPSQTQVQEVTPENDIDLSIEEAINIISTDTQNNAIIEEAINFMATHVPQIPLIIEPPMNTTQPNISQLLDDIMDGFSNDTSECVCIGNAPIKTQEGYPCFSTKKNKWPTYYASVSTITKSIPVNNPNNLPIEYYMFIRFKDAEENTSFAFLDHTYKNMLQKLSTYGIDGIIIEDIVFYSYIKNIDTFVELLKVPGVSYIHDVYKIRKFIGHEKPLKSVELKNILEFMYNTYVFDFNSSSNFMDLYINYKNTANCYTKVNEKDLYDALVYFGYMYKDGSVQHLKRRDKRISTYKFPVSKSLELDLYAWNHKIVARNQQLRADPPISVVSPLHNVPWYVSSAFD